MSFHNSRTLLVLTMVPQAVIGLLAAYRGRDYDHRGGLLLGQIITTACAGVIWYILPRDWRWLAPATVMARIGLDLRRLKSRA